MRDTTMHTARELLCHVCACALSRTDATDPLLIEASERPLCFDCYAAACVDGAVVVDLAPPAVPSMRAHVVPDVVASREALARGTWAPDALTLRPAAL